MTPDTLRIVGAALYGPRWQSDLARDLGVHRDTVRAWARGKNGIGDGPAAAIRDLARQRQKQINDAVNSIGA